MNIYKYLLQDNNKMWIIEFIEILSMDNRFSKFSKNDKAKLTKRIKKMSNLEKKNIEKISVNNNSVSNVFSATNKIKITNNGSWCEELFRHIRNSTFHGKSEVEKKNGKNYFVFKDYTRDKKQSAYICIEEDNLKYILNCYKEALVQIKTEKNYADKDYIKREAA
ncbi:hypothetical protein [Eubacterium sp.]|jgi:archaellum component FlaF (FlaF/FlaG flagellin family)